MTKESSCNKLKVYKYLRGSKKYNNSRSEYGIVTFSITILKFDEFTQFNKTPDCTLDGTSCKVHTNLSYT